MKRYHEYSNKELLELTEDDIARLLTYELMDAGIPLKVQPPPDATPPTAIPSVTLYEVRPDYSKVVSKESADKILEFANQFTCYDVKYSSGYSSPKYAVRTNEPGFTSTRVELYSPEEAEALDKAQREFKDKYGDIVEQREAYKKWQDQVDEHEREIRIAILRAETIQSNFDHYRKAFYEYVDLALGDEHVARAFFIKAYGEDIYDTYVAS